MNGPCRIRRKTRRSANDDEYDHFPSRLLIEPSNLVVYIEDDLVETGVLAPDGAMIVRPTRDPIGFLWDQFPGAAAPLDDHE